MNTIVFLIIDEDGFPVVPTEQGNGIAFNDRSEADVFAADYRAYVMEVEVR